jgi:hypothetical protein
MHGRTANLPTTTEPMSWRRRSIAPALPVGLTLYAVIAYGGSLIWQSMF